MFINKEIQKMFKFFPSQIPERTMDVKTLILREAGKYVVQKTVSQDDVRNDENIEEITFYLLST